jgi:hypothetical protein
MKKRGISCEEKIDKRRERKKEFAVEVSQFEERKKRLQKSRKVEE